MPRWWCMLFIPRFSQVFVSCSAKAVKSCKPFRCSTWSKCYTNERQSCDSNRSATNAGSVRTSFFALGRRYDRQRTLVIHIAAVTLTSASAITIARCDPSKLQMRDGQESETRKSMVLGMRPLEVVLWFWC